MSSTTEKGDGERFRRIGIVGHSRYEELEGALTTLRRFTEPAGLVVSAEEGLRSMLPGSRELRPDELDLLVAFGGDGTLLRGSRMVAPYHTPVLGVNLGYMGFLTSIKPDELERSLERMFQGDYWLDTRFTLEACVINRRGETGPRYLALNDAVLHKGGFARVIRLAVYVGEDREEVGSYGADGIIIGTPTGSTAYSLSANGPIVVPEVDCILATPICPHTLAVRPLVFPADTRISVEILSPDGEMILTIDGQEGEALQPGDRLVTRRGKATVPLVRFEGQSFFATIRRKLHWGIERGE